VKPTHDAEPTTPKPSGQYIEELVSKLKTLETEKGKHLAAVEQLEKEKHAVAAEIQKRLAEQKQQLDEIAGAGGDARSVRPTFKADSALLPKLDTILERLEKLEKRLNQMEKPPAAPVLGTTH
jgi:hypothetical protein